MAVNVITPLSWDTRFFGYPIAKIVLDSKASGMLERLFKQLRDEKFMLAYVFANPDAKPINDAIMRLGGVLIDQKVIFEKMTEAQAPVHHAVHEYRGTKVTDNLLRLVLQAGGHSRFRLDHHFTHNEYERLYAEWLRKSLSKAIALKTFVIKSGSQIAGLTTLGKKAGKAYIGLVAVDEQSRGLGLGSDLVHHADCVAQRLGFPRIQVVTQLHNDGACRLYKKCGFQIANVTNVYHYWNLQ